MGIQQFWRANWPARPVTLARDLHLIIKRLLDRQYYKLPGGGRVFAGQRAEGFYVDLGSIFDLATLRPFENLHLIPTPAATWSQWNSRLQRPFHRD